MPNSSANFEIQRYYKNEPKFNGVYSKKNLHDIRDEAKLITLGEYGSTGTSYWIALHVNGNDVTYFDSFDDEYDNELFVSH